MLGDRWKALDEKGRIPYEKRAAEDKERYENEKAAYNNVWFLHTRFNWIELTPSRRMKKKKKRNSRTISSHSGLIMWDVWDGAGVCVPWSVVINLPL